MYSKMLIPLDGSKTAEQVLPYARLFTSRFKKPVELTALIDSDAFVSDGFDAAELAFGSVVEEIVRSSEDYLQGLAQSFDGQNVACVVKKGEPAEGIIQRGEADNGMLIAMATHGRSGVHRWLLGSIAEKVLRGAVNPLLLVRANESFQPADQATLHSVLAPLDGSMLAESVLPMVAAIAKKLDLAVILLSVYNLQVNALLFGHGYHAFDMERYMRLVKERAHQYLEKKVREIKELGVDKVSCVVREGLAADEVIKLASELSDPLIALCSHGRSGVKRWALGSVTETVVRHSSNPVLVLRAS